jgi:hypothetical protein
MRTYFLNISEEEKKSITEKHRELYNGFQTLQNNGSNITPLQVEDLALDKNGVTLNNENEVMEYRNTNINKKTKKVCEQCSGMYEGVECSCGKKEKNEEDLKNEEYTEEGIKESIKLPSKSKLVIEDINESKKWFKKILK